MAEAVIAGQLTERHAGNRGEGYMALSFLGRGGKSGTSASGSVGGSAGGSGGPRFGQLAEVRAYWEGLREAGALPERDKIDPRGIAGALENTFLLERVAPGIARFRIAGMQVHDLMGMDVRGMPISALFEPAGRSRLSDALEGVFATPAVLELWLEAERGIGRPALEGRLIVLPLTGMKGETEPFMPPPLLLCSRLGWRVAPPLWPIARHDSRQVRWSRSPRRTPRRWPGPPR